jgi:excisionase family DNA binding protein
VKPLVYSVKECAEALDLHRNTVYRLIAAGELPAVRLGKRLVVPCGVLHAELDRRAKTGQGAA